HPCYSKVLTGSATAYSADPAKSIGKFPENAGRDTLLVSAVQASAGRLPLFRLFSVFCI
ncbi:unnamed protein product, partial [Laminaria digitata]